MIEIWHLSNMQHYMPKFMKMACIILAILINNQHANAQQIEEENYGINVGIILALGNKLDRMGVQLNGYYRRGHIQLNPELRLYFNFKNLGPEKQYMEGVVALGLVYGYGRQSADTNYFLTSISNQTAFTNSIGYSFNHYFNLIGTSQQTGIISLQVDQFNLVTENDIFARPKLDRYRTGAFLVQYRYNEYQMGINTTLFTGQMGKKIKDPNYPYAHLYKDTTGGKYTQCSHGLLSAQFQYVAPHYQKIQANLGIDSERVRHLIQNRLIHDTFNSKKHKTAHIPMLDDKKKQYLFKSNQKIKPTSFYYNLFANPAIFY